MHDNLLKELIAQIIFKTAYSPEAMKSLVEDFFDRHRLDAYGLSKEDVFQLLEANMADFLKENQQTMATTKATLKTFSDHGLSFFQTVITSVLSELQDSSPASPQSARTQKDKKDCS